MSKHLETGSISGTGAIYRLEKKFADWLGHPFALATCNATQGLLACFLSLDIRDAEVITTPYTWGGSISGLLMLNNRPVFADIDPATLTLDPGAVRKQITSRTRAILGVDIYGNPCHGEELRKIADEYGIWFIQDCAQSFGALYQHRQSGWMADLAVFSFTEGKPLSTGEGGIITTPHPEVYEQLVWWTQHPRRQMRDCFRLPINEFFLNMRIHPAAACRANMKFRKTLDKVNASQSMMETIDLTITMTLDRQPLVTADYLPSFYRYTIPLSSHKEKYKLFQILKRIGKTGKLENPPIREVLYKHPALKRYVRYSGDICTHAEKAAKERMELKIVLQ